MRCTAMEGEDRSPFTLEDVEEEGSNGNKMFISEGYVWDEKRERGRRMESGQESGLRNIIQ